mgnify:CR=1 FL=1
MYRIKILVHLSLVLFYLSLTLLSCSSSASSISDKPEWVYANRPAGYWYGVGIIDKPYSGNNIRKSARDAAVAEIASQIRIEISSDLTKIFVDDGSSSVKYTESLISTRVSDNISNIELVNSFDSKDKYFILLRLSHDVYYNEIERKRKKAILTSSSLLDQAGQSMGPSSLSLLEDALNEIIPFLDRPLFIDDSNNFNIYTMIKGAISDYFDRISIKPEYEQFEYRLGKSNIISCYIIDKKKNKPIEGLSFNIAYKNQKLPQASVSSSNGLIQFKIPSSISFSGMQFFDIALDISDYWKGEKQIPQIKQTVSVLPEPPSFSFEINETNLGKPTSSLYILPVIKEALANRFNAKLNSVNPDYIIQANLVTRIDGLEPNEWGVYVAFADLEISIHSLARGAEIYSTSTKNIKGASFFSSKDAGNDALIKISQEITDNIVPNLIASIIQ